MEDVNTSVGTVTGRDGVSVERAIGSTQPTQVPAQVAHNDLRFICYPNHTAVRCKLISVKCVPVHDSDIDECKDRLSLLAGRNCHTCHNTIGSFFCSCNQGYREGHDRKSCHGLCGLFQCYKSHVCELPFQVMFG